MKSRWSFLFYFCQSFRNIVSKEKVETGLFQLKYPEESLLPALLKTQNILLKYSVTIFFF